MSSFAAKSASRPCIAKAFAVGRPAFGSLTSLKQERQAWRQDRPAMKGQSNAVVRPSSRRAVQTQALQELYQVADVGSFVTGTAATIFAMTLVGLAIGFVLLRFEALVEEGKI